MWSMPLCRVCHCVECTTVWSVPLCGVCHCIERAAVWSVPLCGVCHCVECATRLGRDIVWGGPATELAVPLC